MRVLIADEDRSLVDVLPPLLRREGHQVVLRAGRGDLAEVVLAEGIHLLIFEPALMPFGWAVQLCRTLRRESATMVLAVSRMAGVAERVRALEAGADDYLTKPFDPEEALARVHALLRRHPLNVVVHGASLVRVTETLSLDLAGQRLVGAQGGDAAGEILLSDREFRLLAYLVRHEGAILTRDALLQAVWGPGYEGSAREVDVYMRYLRQKVESDPATPRYLLTAWGRGYHYKRPAPSPSQLGQIGRSVPPLPESAA